MTGRDVVEHAKRPRRETIELAYAVCGGPLAWLAQVNVTYPLVAAPCFPGPDRNLSFPYGSHWAFILAIAVYLVLLALAVTAALLAIRLYKRFSAGSARSGHRFEGSGAGRLRFMAFCGILLGIGFSGMILLNGPALVMVPPCAI